MVTPPDIEAQILRLYHAEKWLIGTIAQQLHVRYGVGCAWRGPRSSAETAYTLTEPIRMPQAQTAIKTHPVARLKDARRRDRRARTTVAIWTFEKGPMPVAASRSATPRSSHPWRISRAQSNCSGRRQIAAKSCGRDQSLESRG